MRILVVCQHYTPEPFRLSDICEALVQRGHDVTVVTGQPNYPMGRIYDGYRGKERRDEVLNGVKVHRCFTIGRRKGFFWRVLNYYSFAFSSTRYVARLKEEYDVVLVNQLSPVMMASAGVKYKKKHGKKLVMYCMDLWPASLTVGGIREGSLIYKWFHRVSKKLYRRADRILVTSKLFSEYFEQEFGISDTAYLPQYAEETFTVESCKKTPNETVDLMFAGNIGTAQSVQTIVRAAALTKDLPQLRWHVVGDGSDLANCRTLAEELGVDNVIFHGRRPLSEMPRYYAMADAMLITMEKNPFISRTLPGKVQTYMAAGKPMLGAIDGETANLIREADCGYCAPAEDAKALAQHARAFAQSTQREMLGVRARAHYEHHFTKEIFLTRLIEELERFV